MTQYLSSLGFSVPKGLRNPKDCDHGWISPKGFCIFCGEPQKPKTTEEQCSKSQVGS